MNILYIILYYILNILYEYIITYYFVTKTIPGDCYSFHP